MNIGSQVGYWKEKEADRKRKRAKVETLVNRARACRTFTGLDKVADNARAQGLWDAEQGWLKGEIGKCNARLRGRHVPARWIDGTRAVVVNDNKVVNMPWINARTLDKEGFRYAGRAE